MALNNQKNRRIRAIILVASLLLLVFIAKHLLDRILAPEILAPDFSAYTDVKEKKQAFFDFFRPLAEAENREIEAIRERIINLQKQNSPDSDDKQWLVQIASEARLTLSEPVSKEDYEKLLRKIDILPPSLVLAQAAIESAWGTSRFAREGYNYFGQWCFTKGCGIVPNSRATGASHEVQVFTSPRQAVSFYYKNLNSHPAYQKVRDERHQARLSGQPMLGCQLAIGLEKYSAHGKDYINAIHRMIRANSLSPHQQSGCADL